MSRTSKITFTKFHGLGNDFIVTRERKTATKSSKLARAICDRHTGVGADGFLVVQKPVNTNRDARVQFFNADGSEAEMSGNGIRCVAAFLKREGHRKRILRIETAAGVKEVELISATRHMNKCTWNFRVNMGKPVLDPANIPFVAGKHPSPVVGFPIRTAHGILPATVTSMGNPHCSLFVEEFSSTPWEEIGHEIERNFLFPNRTNVEFIRVVSKKEIEVRYWERGVGKTMSSGTGSCGAVVASILNGFTGRAVRVRTLAGTLGVSWPRNSEVLLAGPAELIADGTYYHVG